MSDITQKQVQALSIKHMLDTASPDSTLAMQLQKRLELVNDEIAEATRVHGELLPRESRSLPRAAIFLRGASVQGSFGIKSSLAGEALLQYDRMFTQQAMHDEREEARSAGRQRRVRGTPRPNLLFTGTPRGSFGLEFAPSVTDDATLDDLHVQSLENVAAAILTIAQGDAGELDRAIADIAPGVVQPLKQFLKTLSQHEAELRFAFSTRKGHVLLPEQVRLAAEKMERQVSQVEQEYTVTFRGVTRDSGKFDLRLEDDEQISGNVSDDMSEEDIARIDDLTDQKGIARLLITTVERVGGNATSTYVLLKGEAPAGE